ncbi:MAG: hypothetical protein U1E65_18985 [Myxococcota bacterium]
MLVRLATGALLAYSLSAAPVLLGPMLPRHHRPTSQPHIEERPSGEAWFRQIRGRCNPLEVAVALRERPPPSDISGLGYAAACWGLAGKLDQARAVITKESGERQASAADTVFNVAHPVADQGDDVAAGPLMELVLEFRPENFQALYHAGMSEYALGKNDQAKARLIEFRRLYKAKDFFGNNADRALARIEQGLPPDTASPGAHE